MWAYGQASTCHLNGESRERLEELLLHLGERLIFTSGLPEKLMTLPLNVFLFPVPVILIKQTLEQFDLNFTNMSIPPQEKAMDHVYSYIRQTLKRVKPSISHQ